MYHFVNCSNHPSSKWASDQCEAAEEYGEIIDVRFPLVPPTATNEELNLLVEETLEKIMNAMPVAVMCMGEFVVCYRLVNRLKDQGIPVYASCSERESKEYIDETGAIRKESTFEFKGFREY